MILDNSLWPPESAGEDKSALHQTISDLHHLVGEHVVLRDSRDPERAGELGIDVIENVETPEIDPDALSAALPSIQR